MHPEERALFDKLRRTLGGQIWSKFHHEFCGLVDHEPMAHGSRSSGVACVVARWGRCWCDQSCSESQRVRRVRGARVAETFSAEPWREEWWKTAESVTDALAHAKSVSGKSSRCAIMTTYVDDCDLDAAKPLRTFVWKVVRTPFAAKDPIQMQKLLGVVREAWGSISSCRGLRLTQGDYSEDFGSCTTAGQSVTPLDPKLLPEQPCDFGVRELIGSFFFVTLHALRHFVIARLARFVTRWCEWAPKDIRHMLGFVARTAEWSLILKSADDDWEALRLSTFCDASFSTRCFGGYQVKLTGSRGNSFLIEWASCLQGPQSTSSTESESD